MKLLHIGSTGYIGSAVSQALAHAGHEVVGLLRPSEGGSLSDHRIRIGDLTDLPSLRDALTDDIDGVVHTGAPLGDWTADALAVRTLLDGLRADGTFVYLSGTWVLGAAHADGPSAESSPSRPISIVDGREQVEAAVLESGRRGIVVRAGIAHGLAGGIPGLLVQWARHAGHGRYVSAGEDPTWATVHVEDLADLIAIAVAHASSGTVLHGVSEPAVPAADIARAADLAAGGTGRAVPWPGHEAVAHLGPDFADALALSQHVTADRALALGWRPTRPSIVDELLTGSYRAA